MANEEFDLEVALQFTTTGENAAADALRTMEGLMTDLSSKIEGAGDRFQKLAGNLANAENSLRGVTGSVRQSTSEWEKLTAEIRLANKELQGSAQADVLAGGRAPVRTQAAQMPYGSAREIQAISEAEGASLLRVANERVALEERLQTAKRETLNYEKQASNVGRDRLELAQENAEYAGKELQAAKDLVKEVEASPKTDINDRVVAYESLSEAQKGSASAAKELDSAIKSQESSLSGTEEATISLRYASYDMGRTFLTLAAGITAAGVGVTTAFASQERAFSDVLRTAEGDVGSLEGALRDLSTAIPVSFNDLSKIATLGNQLGVATQDIEAFTTTIATFSAATGVGFEASAEAFGKLGNLLNVGSEDYDRLGSAIAYVGRTTAASESQIISIAREIAPAAAAAGFAADEVIGLSGALGSLAVPPERSRSTILQFFETLNKAVANGGQDLEDFASIVGVTASELEGLVRSGQGEDILSRFVNQAAYADTVQLTQALQNLGLAGLRTNPTIRALAQNTDLLNSSIQSGRESWAENIELQRQMEIINQTVSASWERFLNVAMNTAAGLGATLAPTLKTVLDLAIEMLQGFAQFAESDFGGSLIRLAATLGIVAAGFLAVRGVIALATGSALALKFALQQGIGVGIISGLRGLAGALGLVGSGATVGATGVQRLRVALLGLGRATVVIGALQYISEWLFNTAGAAQQLGNTMIAVASAVANAIRNMTANLGPLFSVAGVLGAEVATGWARDLGKDIADWGVSLEKSQSSAEKFSDTTFEMGNYVEDAGGFMDDLGGATDNATDSAQGLKEEIRSVGDYASDLQGVFSRAFEIRFGVGQSQDATTKILQNMRKEAEDAAVKLRDVRTEIRGLNADMGKIQSDIGTQQYYLSIALEYGDTARAEAIQANLAKLQADLAKKGNDLTDANKDLKGAQDATSTSLKGNSDQAIKNRDSLDDLFSSYQDQIVALANSGASQEDVRRIAEKLRQDFIKQATQLGYNTKDLQVYDGAFKDLITTIERVPRNVSVSMEIKGLGPAQAAIKEFETSAKNAMDRIKGSADKAGGAIGGLSSGIGKIPSNKNLRMDMTGNLIDRIREANTWLQNSTKYKHISVDAGGGVHGLRSGFASGGYTGGGGKYEPAGTVHRGEYVIPKRDVNQTTGMPNADALGRLMQGQRGYANGGYVRPAAASSSAGLGVVSLSAGSIQALAHAVQPYLVLDNQLVGQASSKAFSHDNRVGAY